MKRTCWVCMLVFGLMLSWTLVYAGDFYVVPTKKKNYAPVAKTGQTECYKSDGTTGTCTPGTANCPEGQDGDLEKGVPWPNPRFTDNGNGTVTDNLTGLIWLKNASCMKFWFLDSTGSNVRGWSEALTAANALEPPYCGLSDGSGDGDWRLPNRRELDSLLDMGYCVPFLSDTAGTGHWSNDDPFTAVMAENSNYWSSTTTAGLAGYAFAVSIGDGQVLSYTKDNTFQVWPVRDGK